MSNMMDMLLAADVKGLERPSSEKEIKRLSDVLGSPFILELEALTVDEFSDIQKGAIKMKKNAKLEEIDTEAVQIQSIIMATKNVDFGAEASERD